jgi:arylsulfatase A-like enzyme
VRETVKVQATCGLIEVINFFEHMKEKGVYENALIILMADHGAWVPPTGMTGKKSEDGHSIEVINPQVMALARPVFAIKRPGDSGKLRFSDAQTSVIDTPATIAEQLKINGGFDGTPVFMVAEEQQRERVFNAYQYQRSEWTDEYLSPIHEFAITGNGVNSNSWKEQFIHYPGGNTRKSTDTSPYIQQVRH